MPAIEEAAVRHELNEHQQRAVGKVDESVAAGVHRTFLLHGVTGSGKTEVYLRILEEVRKRGRSGIVLVPEISLTPQTVGRFASRFPDVAVLHSGLTDAERGRQWQRLLQGKSKVLMRLDAVTPAWISQIQYVSEDGIRKQEDVIRKATRALFLAQRFMRAQPQDAAEIVSKKIGWAPDAVLAAHKISGGLMSEDGQISMHALKNMQDTLLEYGMIKKRLPLEDHVAKGFAPVRM